MKNKKLKTKSENKREKGNEPAGAELFQAQFSLIDTMIFLYLHKNTKLLFDMDPNLIPKKIAYEQSSPLNHMFLFYVDIHGSITVTPFHTI